MTKGTIAAQFGPRKHLRRTLHFEHLEDRSVLSTFMVLHTADSGPDSLRQAILDANDNPGADQIGFNIPGVGPFSISPTSALPDINDTVVLDATTQPGFAGSPIVELDGRQAGPVNALVITADDTIVRGLAINRFSGPTVGGIFLSGTVGSVIQGNYIGTNLTGNADFPAGPKMDYGIVLFGTSHSVIGTDGDGNNDDLEGNVISGQSSTGILAQVGASNNVIAGNRIGTSADGQVPLGNGRYGLFFLGAGTNNRIGTNVDGRSDVHERNIIAGNTEGGILLDSNDNTIAGNSIGTDAGGTLPLGNGHGIWISASSRNTVGGSDPAAANTIAFNTGDGVFVEGGMSNAVLGNSIFENTGLGINLFAETDLVNGVTVNDLDDGDIGSNRRQNFPVLNNLYSNGPSSSIHGTLQSAADTMFRIEFFASPACDRSGHGEGMSYLGTDAIHTDATGFVSFVTSLAIGIPLGQFVAATVTDPSGNTSEFSSCRDVIPVQTNYLVDTLIDETDGDYSPGDLSLREAIELANTLPDSNTITFDPAMAGGAILLTEGDLRIAQAVSILGPGPHLLTIDAAGNDPTPLIRDGNGSRVFTITDEVFSTYFDVELRGITLTGGDSGQNFGGGAILNLENLTLSDSVITGNSSFDGGGIQHSAGSLTILDSSIAANVAQPIGGFGGGLAISYGTHVTITNSVIHGNSGTRGGGIATTSASSLLPATVRIRNSTISNNTAVDGGGIYGFHNIISLEHVTVTANTATRWGSGTFSTIAGAPFEMRLEIYSSIIAGNARNDDVNDSNVELLPMRPSVIQSLGYNLIGGTNVQEFTASADRIGADAMLGPLSNNGGPTWTHELLNGSPAIDSGDPTAIAGQPGVPEFDQRGASFSRVVGSRMDRGAFEVQVSMAPDIDFNDDGLYNCHDIDALVAHIAAATNDAGFDLTSDQLVNLDDRDAWLAAAGAANLGIGHAYRLGDATLDGLVDGTDFNRWNANRFTTGGTWCNGDFSADGVIDGSDFNVWNVNTFLSSALGPAQAIYPQFSPARRGAIPREAFSTRSADDRALSSRGEQQHDENTNMSPATLPDRQTQADSATAAIDRHSATSRIARRTLFAVRTIWGRRGLGLTELDL